MHQSLFTLVYFTKGGITHTEAYQMPVYLRTFYLKQLQEVKQQESDAMKEGSKSKRPTKR